MAHINVNLETTPDKFELLPAGIYVCVIEEANLDEAKSGGQKIVAKLRVEDESNPNNGRMIYDHIGLKNPISLKQLVKSAGLPVSPQGVNTEDLIGKIVRVRLATRTYKDPETQEIKETTSVKEYLFS